MAILPGSVLDRWSHLEIRSTRNERWSQQKLSEIVRVASWSMSGVCQITAKTHCCFEAGKVGSIENNHKELQEARKGMTVAVKIEASTDAQAHLLFGRHFDHSHRLYSSLTRSGIEALKVQISIN